MKQQKDNWVKILFSFAAPCKGKMALSVFCAILSVAGGFIPFWAVYEILLAFINQNVTLNGILIWCLVGAAGYLLRVACHGISTILAHISAYTILEGIRLKIADRLMKAPLGEVMGRRIGYLKNIIMDKVEDLEPPLAHMIPEFLTKAYKKPLQQNCYSGLQNLFLILTVSLALNCFTAYIDIPQSLFIFQHIERIDILSVCQYLIMNMRTSAVACTADKADDLAFDYLLPCSNGNAAHVAIGCFVAITMIYTYIAPVATVPACLFNRTGSRSINRQATTTATSTSICRSRPGKTGIWSRVPAC